MTKTMNQIYFSLFALALLASSLLLLKYSNTSTAATISIITKDTPYHNKVLKGFMAALKKNKGHEYSIITYTSTTDDKILTAALTKAAIEKKPDILVTIGSLCSQLCAQFLKKEFSTVPLVFAGAGNPVDKGILSKIKNQPENITGVNTGEQSYASSLLKIRTDLKRVLIPYSPLECGGELITAAEELEKFFHSHGITTVALPLEKVGEIIPKIKSHISDVDAVLQLENCISNDATESIIDLCNDAGATLFTNELSSVKKGASCGFGSNPELVGKHTFLLVNKIIADKVPAHTIPVKQVDNGGGEGRHLAVNIDTSLSQGLAINANKLLLLRELFPTMLVYRKGKWDE